MGDGMAGSSALRLTGISPEGEQSLVFSFTGAAGDFQWTFQPGSTAEFLALLLGGSIRPGQGVSIPHANVSLKPGKGGAAEMLVSLGAVDLVSTLDAAALEALAASIARIQAAPRKR